MKDVYLSVILHRFMGKRVHRPTFMSNKTPISWSLTARWIFPVAGPPLPDGRIVIERDRIRSIEPCGQVQADIDLGNVAIVPGFANAHTHLDLTGLHGKRSPSPDFTAWLRGVIAHRRSQTPDGVVTDIRAGLAQSIQNGVTLLGDISAGGLSWPDLAAAPLRAVVFYEMLGLTEERAQLSWQDADSWLQAHSPTETCRPGLSPHAPYSVRQSLFEKAASCPPQIPVAIHLAETTAEMLLLERHEGPFVQFLQEMGVWDPQGLSPSIQHLLDTFSRRKPLWIHGNYLEPTIPSLKSGVVIYCPRTHAAFGHSPHPFQEFRKLGVQLALGTDSLASNPDLSILEEIRFLFRQYPDLDTSWLLYLATLAGAEVLGWSSETGSLAPGKSADLVVIPLPDRDEADPHRLLLDSTFTVKQVLFRGHWVKETI